MFWFLDFAWIPGARLWNDDSDEYLEGTTCSFDPDHARATRRWQPAVFREESKLDQAINPLFDALSTPRPSFVLRDSVFAALSRAGLTGWLRNPVRIRQESGRVDETFGELWINGFAGIAGPHSGCRLIWRCRTCGDTHYEPGFVVAKGFDESQWDGSDFFTFWPLANYRFCTDRAKRVLEGFHVEEIRFRRVDELTKPLQIYGDSRIPPFYKPEARAAIERFWSEAPPAPPPA